MTRLRPLGRKDTGNQIKTRDLLNSLVLSVNKLKGDLNSDGLLDDYSKLEFVAHCQTDGSEQGVSNFINDDVLTSSDGAFVIDLAPNVAELKPAVYVVQMEILGVKQGGFTTHDSVLYKMRKVIQTMQSSSGGIVGNVSFGAGDSVGGSSQMRFGSIELSIANESAVLDEYVTPIDGTTWDGNSDDCYAGAGFANIGVNRAVTLDIGMANNVAADWTAVVKIIKTSTAKG